MTTKEKVVRASIKKASKRLNNINYILSATPLSDILQLSKKMKELLDKCKTIEERTSDEFVEKIGKMAKEEKRLIALAKKQQNTNKLIEEAVRIKMELSELKTELWAIQRR